MIARIRTDQSLADFEGGVTNLMRDVEDAYWELYFTYRDLEARKLGRDSALETWKKTAALLAQRCAAAVAPTAKPKRVRSTSCSAARWSRRSPICIRAENRLAVHHGPVDVRRPVDSAFDEPTTARVAFDWQGIHCEAITRRVEIRKEKWQIKRRELELIAARNMMLPRLDAVGRYRWLGLGDELIDARAAAHNPATWTDSTAFGRSPAASSRNGSSACS